MNKFHPICNQSEIPVGKSKLVEVSGKIIALFHTPLGYFALDDRCPHRGGPLSEGEIREGDVTCPWHQARFELSSGQCRSSKDLKVATYLVQIHDGYVGILL